MLAVVFSAAHDCRKDTALRVSPGLLAADPVASLDSKNEAASGSKVILPQRPVAAESLLPGRTFVGNPLGSLLDREEHVLPVDGGRQEHLVAVPGFDSRDREAPLFQGLDQPLQNAECSAKAGWRNAEVGYLIGLAKESIFTWTDFGQFGFDPCDQRVGLHQPLGYGDRGWLRPWSSSRRRTYPSRRPDQNVPCWALESGKRHADDVLAVSDTGPVSPARHRHIVPATDLAKGHTGDAKLGGHLLGRAGPHGFVEVLAGEEDVVSGHDV